MAGDTIFALSTASGAAGIAIIRVSGPGSRFALERLCGSVPVARMATVRTIREPETGEIIDSGVILFFPNPGSFTGEDLAELQVHGSLAVIRQILGCLGRMPEFRAAEAGEFTQRAFFRGKMDLIEVEALGDLLAAETAAQARLAQLQRLNLRAAAKRWRTNLIEILSLTEAYIDFSDEGDVGEAIDSSAEQEIRDLARDISQALAALETGERIRRGYRIAVLGPPNAGKSSLVNVLAARDVAITSTIPGTTRDTIEVHLDLRGLPVVLIDTAGLRDTDDAIERLGVERATHAAAEADLVLWLSAPDASEPCPFGDALGVKTKADLLDSYPLQESMSPAISTRTGAGISALIDELHRRAEISMHIGSESILVAHARQASELHHAILALGRAQQHRSEHLELRAEELRLAKGFLDRLTGRIGYDEILGSIFSKFCIGK